MRTQRFLGGMALVVLASLAPMSQASEQVNAAPVSDVSADIEVFKGPVPARFGRPIYPEVEAALRNEGWVQLNMMIDPRGKPYEIAVVDSSGNEMFERAALMSIKDWTFQPATLGNQPVDASFTYKLTFLFRDPSDGARTQFVRAYKRLLKAINAGDQAGADAELARLEITNLYEDAYSNVGRYQYHLKWGTEAQQLTDLKRAIAGEYLPRYLPNEVFIDVVRSLLTLQLRAKDFASAVKTWETLQKFAVDDLDKVKAVMAKVEALRTSDTSYAVDAEIDKGTSWFYTLFKNRFQIAVTSGHVAEVKLRCDKKYVFFRYQPDVQYRISDRYGSCALELVGDHGTKFSLVQS